MEMTHQNDLRRLIAKLVKYAKCVAQFLGGVLVQGHAVHDGQKLVVGDLYLVYNDICECTVCREKYECVKGQICDVCMHVFI